MADQIYVDHHQLYVEMYPVYTWTSSIHDAQNPIEDRWLTLGISDAKGVLPAVVHLRITIYEAWVRGDWLSAQHLC